MRLVTVLVTLGAILYPSPTEGVSYTSDGLKINEVSTCIRGPNKNITCAYGTKVRVLGVKEGVKTYECPISNPECCEYDETDCVQNSLYVNYQAQLCRNLSSCVIFGSGGIRIHCGVTAYVYVTYACEGGGPTTVTTTTILTTQEEPVLPVESSIRDNEKKLGLILGLSFGLLVFVLLLVLCIVYIRTYNGEEDLIKASNRPPPVTQLGIKVDKSQAPVKTISRFRASALEDYPWPSKGYERFGAGDGSMVSTPMFPPYGNLWKNANWLSSVNAYSRFPHAVKKTSSSQTKLYEKNSQQKARNWSKGIEEDNDSLELEDDLNTLPDITMFSIPEGRASPDSGLDTTYILPTIRDKRIDSDPTIENNAPDTVSGKYKSRDSLDGALVLQPKPELAKQIPANLQVVEETSSFSPHTVGSGQGNTQTTFSENTNHQLLGHDNTEMLY